jgi:hypothetical protein
MLVWIIGTILRASEKKYFLFVKLRSKGTLYGGWGAGFLQSRSLAMIF